MNTPTHDNPVDRPVDNSIAAIMTMMLPGLGQLMKGQVMPGIFWALAVGFGYFSFFWPGLIAHGACILDAAFNRKEQTKHETNWKKFIGLIALVVGLLAYIILRNF